MRKWIDAAGRVLLAFGVGFSLLSGVSAAPAAFSDVVAGSWYAPFVLELSAAGVISGYPDGTFRPDNTVSAAECLSLVLLSTGVERPEPVPGEHWGRAFADYALERGWLEEEIEALDAPVTRLTVARLAARALGLAGVENGVFTDTQDPEVNALYDQGVVSGSYSHGERVFLPEEQLTRAQISAIVSNLRACAQRRAEAETPEPVPGDEVPLPSPEELEQQIQGDSEAEMPTEQQLQEDGEAEMPPERDAPAPEGAFFEEQSPAQTDGQEDESFSHGDWIFYRDRYITILPDVAVNRYDPEAFQADEDGVIDYVGPGVETRQGIDVSNHQGDVDWEKVAADGVDFVFLRVGYRGFGSAGRLCNDIRFDQNIQGALAAGLDVGVYYFSQATNAEEAVEEAEYVIAKLQPYRDALTYPVVYDWEDSSSSELVYRVHGMSTQELGVCAVAFCQRVAQEGYQPMIYFNQHDGYLRYDLSEIDEYPFWYAQYPVQSSAPSFYYDFDLWQYSSHGAVDGIETRVDRNLQLIKTASVLARSDLGESGQAVRPKMSASVH